MIDIATPRGRDASFQSTQEFSEATADERAVVRALHRDGFAIIDLKLADFDALAETVKQETTRRYGGSARVQDAWRQVPAIKKMATNLRVMSLLQFAYGRRAIPFQTLNFRVGTQQMTHSDTIHFNSVPGNFMCGVWVAYEDADASNGALHYFPGSHLLPALTLEDLGIPAATLGTRTTVYQEYEKALAIHAVQQCGEKVVIPVRKGQALIWTANLFHGGESIADKSLTRFSQVTHYFFDECLYMQPLWSDFQGKRIAYKKVFDIATDRYITPKYNGQPRRLPLVVHFKEFVMAKILRVRVS